MLRQPGDVRSPVKFYVVRCGVQLGIYYTWENCKQHVDRFKGARFKSFATKKEAKEFLGVGET
jgi:viroplasmin and RNaseH domain-containing protein